MSGSRRKVALARVILLLSFVACVAVVVFGANNGWPEELWAWALWTVPGWVFLGALRHWADVTGRLAPLRNRGLGALAFSDLDQVLRDHGTPERGRDLRVALAHATQLDRLDLTVELSRPCCAGFVVRGHLLRSCAELW